MNIIKKIGELLNWRKSGRKYNNRALNNKWVTIGEDRAPIIQKYDKKTQTWYTYPDRIIEREFRKLPEGLRFKLTTKKLKQIKEFIDVWNHYAAVKVDYVV